MIKRVGWKGGGALPLSREMACVFAVCRIRKKNKFSIVQVHHIVWIYILFGRISDHHL